MGIPIAKLIHVIPGQTEGSFGHRLVALELARWCDPFFSIQCNQWAEEILIKGYVIAKTDQQTLERLQTELTKLQKKEKWLRKANQELLDRDELWIETNLIIVTRLFINFVIKMYTHRGVFLSYNAKYDGIEKTNEPYQFERFWLKYWDKFLIESTKEISDFYYQGAIDLKTLDKVRILYEVSHELKHNQKYHRFRHDVIKHKFDVYQEIVNENKKIK